jgi:NAD(P)H-dependent flavin oxidoreductase YrpB (nitropropane dioxygenase family)
MSLEKIFYSWMDRPRFPIIQGGMGAGISLLELAAAVSKADAMGTLSSVALNQFTSKRTEERLSTVDATAREVSDTRKAGGFAAINIMAKLVGSYEESIEGAVKGGANMIVVGAGLPANLPHLVEKFYGSKNHNIGIVPIVSSAQVLDIIIHRYWQPSGYMPDAIVLEGPKAGGHIGWSYKMINRSGENFLKKYDLLDVLLPEVLELLNKGGYDIPVFVAGGIRNRKDINIALKAGASGVQIGTPFVVAYESGASEDFKRTIIESNDNDVRLGNEAWGSPASYPFRYNINSPLATEVSNGSSFCICRGLISATNNPELTNNDSKGCPEGYVKPLHGACPAAGNIINKPLYTMGTDINSITKKAYAADIIGELVE